MTPDQAQRPLYLDANASEPLRPAARQAALAALDMVGNPSSVHAAGRAARRVLEDARDRVAAWAGAAPAGVVFTGGGTEANTLALHAFGAARPVAIGATEHPAVRAAAPGAQALPVDGDGLVDLAALSDWLARVAPPALVCIMAANNETGTIQPLAEAQLLCRRHGAWLHVDAVQIPGRLPCPPAWDSMALSGHKAGGPKGAGALALRREAPVPALIVGGGQERGRRGGTEALPAIAGFGAALTVAEPLPATRSLRDAIESAARDSGATVVAARADRLPNTACLALPGRPAERQVIALDLAGIAVSAGSACSSGRVAASGVLQAMGLDALAGCAIRVSVPWDAPGDAALRFAQAYAAMAGRMTRAA